MDEGLRLFLLYIWVTFLELEDHWIGLPSPGGLWCGDGMQRRGQAVQPLGQEGLTQKPRTFPPYQQWEPLSAVDLTQKITDFPGNVCFQSEVQERAFQTVGKRG